MVFTCLMYYLVWWINVYGAVDRRFEKGAIKIRDEWNLGNSAPNSKTFMVYIYTAHAHCSHTD